MFNLTMKCPMIKSTKESMMEKSLAAAEAKVLYPKDSPKKETSPVKPQHSPAGVTTELFPIKSDTSTVHNKENSTNREQDGISDEFFEDSGYLSLINSHIDHHVDEEGEVIAGIHRGKTISANNSPTKCQGSARLSLPGTLSVHTPVDRHKRTTGAMSSTPANQHRSNLPILRFQQDVCEELAKSYKKNKRYDWSVIPKIAEDHLLDRIIGGQIGLEHIDMFTSLLVRNMKIILTNILAMLGDMDLISCRQVSRTWRKIICEDSAAMRRCRQAEQALRESRSSRMKTASGMTRDLATSRVVLSCMQTLASSSTPASSQSPSRHSCRTTRHTPTSRFSEYSQAASSLKQHESLRSCKRCGSPATHSAEVQRARCTRSSCLFEFCTRCQEPFHGSAPCRTVKPHMNCNTSKVTPIIAGGPRSKQSVRRL